MHETVRGTRELPSVISGEYQTNGCRYIAKFYSLNIHHGDVFGRAELSKRVRYGLPLIGSRNPITGKPFERTEWSVRTGEFEVPVSLTNGYKDGLKQESERKGILLDDVVVDGAFGALELEIKTFLGVQDMPENYYG